MYGQIHFAASPQVDTAEKKYKVRIVYTKYLRASNVRLVQCLKPYQGKASDTKSSFCLHRAGFKRLMAIASMNWSRRWLVAVNRTRKDVAGSDQWLACSTCFPIDDCGARCGWLGIISEGNCDGCITSFLTHAGICSATLCFSCLSVLPR